MTEIRLILGDQLHYGHSWFKVVRPNVHYVMAELREELSYAPHHVQKMVGFLGAMWNFAAWLRKQGHQVHHFRIDDPAHPGDLEAVLRHVVQQTDANAWAYMEPDEYRLDRRLAVLSQHLGLPVRICSTEHFLTDRETVATLFQGKKTRVMETFYREMRRKTGILMEGKDPIGGQWNFDADNRKKWNGSPPLPAPKIFAHEVKDILAALERAGIQGWGEIDPEKFLWPLTRKESLILLQDFVTRLLPYFGAYQDAMTGQGWSLWHARLSFSLNTKMLHPMEVIQAVEQAYKARPSDIPLSAAEGFIRQILGWREYVRGIYWAEMPGYAQMNYLEHHQPLPTWYWTGKTRMQCMKDAIGQTRKYAYAHHIQRLMVTGAFGLMAGVSPDEMDAWYLGAYMDAVEWVEMPNTRGMSQFADGGIMGTKPYLGSANYMHKMSDACARCVYDKDQRHGEKACPLNALYWDFHLRHREKLERNPRIGMVYRTLDKMDPEELTRIQSTAARHLKGIEEL